MFPLCHIPLQEQKALGCGVPVGAFLMTEKVGLNSLKAGDHGTTYGGNPLACAAICKVLDLYEKEHILEHVQEAGVYLEEQLDALAAFAVVMISGLMPNFCHAYI